MAGIKGSIRGFAVSNISKLTKGFKGPNKNVLKAGRKGAMHNMPKVRGGRSGGF